MRIRTVSLVLAAAVGLAACGDTPAERAIYGGAAGAGTAAVFDGNILAGAAVGAAGNVIYCQENPGKC